jgi:hypothetical protein
MKPQIVVVALISSFVAFLLCGAVHDVVAAPAVTVAAFDAGPDVAPAPAVEAPPPVLPDPVAAPIESAGLLLKAYKGGGLIGALILLAFFGLSLAQRWVAWLRQGWRRLVVSSLLVGLAMLCERIAAGTTPTLAMVMGAAGAALALYTSGKGEPAA